MNIIKRRSGISLVALIITIIVLIILTAAVVITGINTPENNEYAVKMHNKATLQDAVTLYVMTEMLNNIDNFVVTSTGATKARDVDDVVKDLYENGTWKDGANIKLGVNMTLDELNIVFELDDQAVVTFAEGQAPTLDGTESDNNQSSSNNNAPQTYSWANKTAVFVGDSITAGVGTTKTYWKYLQEQIPLSTVTGKGIAGSCISVTSDYGTNNTPLINRYQTIPDADLISIFMGTNDYGHKTPLGTIADTTDVSFYGALNVIIPGIKEAHPNSTIVYITPLHRYGFGGFTYDTDKNAANANLADYVNAIKEVCQVYDIPVIDLNTLFDLDVTDATVRTQYAPDGLHPNAAGHQIMADLIIEELKKIAPPVNSNQQAGNNNNQSSSNNNQSSENSTQGSTSDSITMVFGNVFVDGFKDAANRASPRKNIYLEAGTVISLKDTSKYNYAVYTVANETTTSSSGNLGSGSWHANTLTVATSGWYGFAFKRLDNADFGFGTADPNVLSGYVNLTK